jgi:hypothetical protein
MRAGLPECRPAPSNATDALSVFCTLRLVSLFPASGAVLRMRVKVLLKNAQLNLCNGLKHACNSSAKHRSEHTKPLLTKKKKPPEGGF